MTHRSSFARGLFVLALALPVAASAQHGGRIDVPEVPANLTVEEGNTPYLQTRAYGTQNYVCLPSAHGRGLEAVRPAGDAVSAKRANPDRHALPEPESGRAGHATGNLAAFDRRQRGVGAHDPDLE